MKIWLVVSVQPNGSRALVGHYKEYGEDRWRSEVYDTKEDADHEQSTMQSMFSDRGMRYEVIEVEV